MSTADVHELIADRVGQMLGRHQGHGATYQAFAGELVRHLAAAGLLITPEAADVIDAALLIGRPGGSVAALAQAADAYRNASGLPT